MLHRGYPGINWLSMHSAELPDDIVMGTEPVVGMHLDSTIAGAGSKVDDLDAAIAVVRAILEVTHTQAKEMVHIAPHGVNVHGSAMVRKLLHWG